MRFRSLSLNEPGIRTIMPSPGGWKLHIWACLTLSLQRAFEAGESARLSPMYRKRSPPGRTRPRRWIARKTPCWRLLSGYLYDRRPLPVPGKAKRGQPVVVLPPRAAIKPAIHEAMCEQGVTQAQLGEMLGIDGRQVRRILNLERERPTGRRRWSAIRGRKQAQPQRKKHTAERP